MVLFAGMSDYSAKSENPLHVLFIARETVQSEKNTYIERFHRNMVNTLQSYRS